MAQYIRKHVWFFLILAIYLVFNIYGLTKFPGVGGDEGFLAKLAYLYHLYGVPIINPNLSDVGCQKGFTFFFPTGFLYFSSLALIGKIFGFGLFAMRSHALVFSLLTIVLTYHCSLLLFRDRRKACLAAVLLAASSHFMTLAHTVRQEMMLTAALLVIVDLYCLWKVGVDSVFLYLAGFIAAAAVSIHGNGIYFVPFFLLLLGWHHFTQTKLATKQVLFMLISLMVGGAVFLLFDYWPYHEYYWKSFNAPMFQGAHLAHYQRLVDNPFKEIGSLVVALWNYFWTTRYHNGIIYPILYLTTIIAGFWIRSRSNDFLMFVLLLLFIVLLPAHLMIYYVAYAAPLSVLLLASILIDIQDRFQLRNVGIVTLGVLLLLLILNPIAQVWFRRGYNWEESVALVKLHMESGLRFMADGAFFFGLDPEKLYDHHPLKCGYDLETFMKENNVHYFISSCGMNWSVPEKNSHLKKCRQEAVTPEFQTVMGSSKAPFITIFDCRDAF